MLVITRRAGESVAIGPDITVKILSIDGNQASIGIEAPRDIAVIRHDAKSVKP